jgi:hypothetical protein
MIVHAQESRQSFGIREGQVEHDNIEPALVELGESLSECIYVNELDITAVRVAESFPHKPNIAKVILDEQG